MQKFVVHIEHGLILNKKVVAAGFNSLPDGSYLVSIDIRKKARSIRQNAYYHGICVPLVREGLQEVGYEDIRTNEQAHEVLKMLFLKKQVVVKGTGECLEYMRSTTDLSTIEFMEYIERIIQFGAEDLGIRIPYPSEKLLLKFG